MWVKQLISKQYLYLPVTATTAVREVPATATGRFATTAITTTAALTATAKATAATTTTTAIFTRFGLINAQATTINIDTIQPFNSGIGGGIAHFYEAKATKTAAVTVINHCD